MVDRNSVVMLEDALDAIGDKDSALRARLLGRLAVGLELSEMLTLGGSGWPTRQ